MNPAPPKHRRLSIAALSLALALGGCATGPQAHPQDPLEPLNRQVQRFNDGLDEAVLKPVASTYQDVTPSPVRAGVGNFFGNLRDAWSALNGVLQVRPREAAENAMRFGVNTVFGLAGLLDIASEMGIPRTKLDFGQTLGWWGVPAGPYLVLPVLGPSSVRDTVGTVVDGRVDPVNQADNVATRNAGTVLRGVDTRAKLLGATDVLEGAALDKYSFIRDAYLQRRAQATGQAPAEERYDLD